MGLITYMRTDSLRISDEAPGGRPRASSPGATAQATVPASPGSIKTKAGAQDAHEAIRPSDVQPDPGAASKSDLTSGPVPALPA